MYLQLYLKKLLRILDLDRMNMFKKLEYIPVQTGRNLKDEISTTEITKTR